MRRATGLGPERQVIWEGRHAPPDGEHLCGGLYGPGETYVSEWVQAGAWCVAGYPLDSPAGAGIQFPHN